MPIRTTPVRIGMDLSSTDATVLRTGMCRRQACITPGSICHGLHAPHHRDPFDRLLAAQAQLEKLPIVTADPQLARYDVTVIEA